DFVNFWKNTKTSSRIRTRRRRKILMDFTLFTPRELISPLIWLGRQDWLDFGCGTTSRTIWSRVKHLNIPPEEKNKYSPEHWRGVETIIQSANRDIVDSFYALSLSKAIVGGPKVFQPTFEDCISLENTDCSMTFEEYKQPYPVIIIELPKEYKH